MEFLRTPEERFANLVDYPFQPHYLEVDGGLRMHYSDEGPADGAVVLLLHGEPSWSYLYRKMIPILTAAGHRVVAPDLIGFGKSDKPTQIADYSYAAHLQWMRSFLSGLNLQGINLFCQDWGGLLGLRLAVEMEDRFDRLIISNTALPTGKASMPPAFEQWKNYALTAPEFPIGRVVNSGSFTELPPEVIAAYDAPFPDESYKAGARAFPALVPATEDDLEAANNQLAWEQLKQWQKPTLTLFSDSDPIMKGGERYFQAAVPGAAGQPHVIIENGGHFLQEDKGEEIAEKIIAFIKQS
ncbi:MAG: haloalkane dehalogenase [Bacteroidota bacterium]